MAGVDGGATRMRAVVLDGEGRERARVVGEGAVVSEADPGSAADAVAVVVRRAARAAGATLPLDGLWAGLAGAGREEARAGVEAALRSRGLARRVDVGTDVEAAFHDAFGDGPGVLLLAGTGSVAWARDSRGEMARAGGWGQWLGDEGSGWALGIAALRALVRAADGRGPATGLWPAVRRALGLPEDAGEDALVPWVAGASKAQVAALAPVVAGVAAAGDAVAAGLLDAAAAALVEHVKTLSFRVSAETSEGAAGSSAVEYSVALAGGLLTGEDGVLRTRVLARLKAAGYAVRPDLVDALRGAGRRALSEG